MPNLDEQIERIRKSITLLDSLVEELRMKDYAIFKQAKKALPHFTDEQWEVLHPKGKEYNRLIRMEEKLKED